MTDPTIHSLEGILRQIAAAAPQPWYPADFARDGQVERDSLDPFLDDLRMAGLIRLTDWVQGHGQGYALTDEGQQVLASARDLNKLRDGIVPHRQPRPEPLSEQETTFARGEAARAALFADTSPIVTRYLILANFMFFGAGMLFASQLGVPIGDYLMKGSGKVFAQLGGMSPFEIAQGEWWRTMTTAFLHMGVIHIGMNMYALWVLGRVAERLWGHWRLLVIYLVSAFVSSCTVLVLNPNTLTVGASGAICGVLGAEIGWYLLNRRHLGPEHASAWGRNLVTNVVLITVISLVPGVSAAGHFGGAVGGFLVAVLLQLQRQGNRGQSVAALLAVLVVPVAAFGLVLNAMNTNPLWFKLRVQGPAIEIDKSTTLLDELYVKRIAPLVRQPVPRDEREVDDVLAQLDSVCAEIGRLEQREQRPAFPYNADLDETRLLGLQYLESCGQLCKMARNILREGPGWQQDSKTIEGHFIQSRQQQQRWVRMVNRIVGP